MVSRRNSFCQIGPEIRDTQLGESGRFQYSWPLNLRQSRLLYRRQYILQRMIFYNLVSLLILKNVFLEQEWFFVGAIFIGSLRVSGILTNLLRPRCCARNWMPATDVTFTGLGQILLYLHGIFIFKKMSVFVMHFTTICA